MRKLVCSAMMSLDAVMQAPGGPTEDTSGGFEFGGWTVPLMDDAGGKAIGGLFAEPFDLLLGRRTYEIFAGYWPRHGDTPIGKAFNAARKYVATRSRAPLAWNHSVAIHDAVTGVAKLKQQPGPTLLTQGSTELLHALLAGDLVDEMQLFVFPLLLGKGKRLFDERAAPATMKLIRTEVTTTGVVMSRYRRVGDVETGSFDSE